MEFSALESVAEFFQDKIKMATIKVKGKDELDWIKMNVHTSLNHGLIQHGRPFSLSCPVALSESCPNLITHLIFSLIILQFIFLQVHILASPMYLLFKLKLTG